MNKTVYWIGHHMLGDVVGFVAAAHLYSIKTQTRIPVFFQNERKNIVKYFDGVDYVDKIDFDGIPNKIDCGIDPPIDMWSQLNGVKRFYRFMDPEINCPKSFDIHFNIQRIPNNNLIGLITHANTQGDIPDHIVDDMIKNAKIKYPYHQIVAIGNMDNKYVPNGVIDWRQPNGDVDWIVDKIRRLDLLITPQSGPCFLAAGFKIPMWVYRSKQPFWDYVLNYDTYKVDRWWDRSI